MEQNILILAGAFILIFTARSWIAVSKIPHGTCNRCKWAEANATGYICDECADAEAW